MTKTTKQSAENDFVKEKQQNALLEEMIFGINYSEPLDFLRKHREQFIQTSELISMLETLQSISYYYKNTNKKTYLLSYLNEQSTTNPEKALQELNPLLDLVPFGKSINTALELIIERSKSGNNLCF